MNNVLKEARAWGERNYPQASALKHATFANSVLYVMYHVSGGYGGPSIREHTVSKAVNDVGKTFTDFEEACRLVAPIVYGPLTELHRQVWDDLHTITIDNDEDDERQLKLYRAN